MAGRIPFSRGLSGRGPAPCSSWRRRGAVWLGLASLLAVTGSSPALQVGNVAPPWSLPDPRTGQRFSSTNFAGKVVLLDFFDLACGNCYAEMPRLAALHNRYTNLGLVVIGVSMHDSRTALTSYLASVQVPFPVGWVSPTYDPAGEQMLFNYGLSSGVALPYGVLVDYRNIVTNLNQGGWNAAYLDAMVRRQLTRTAPPLLHQRAAPPLLVSWSTIATNPFLEFTRLSPVAGSTSWSPWAAYPTNGLTVVYDRFTNQFIQLPVLCTNRATFFRLKKP